MNRWESWRFSLLVTMAFSILFVLLKSFESSSLEERKVAQFVFPETIPLREWQQEASTSTDRQMAVFPEEISRKDYRYIQDNFSLDIQMRYLTHSNGDVQRLVKEYAKLDSRQLAPIIRQQAGIGFYGLFVHQEQAALSACINPQGGSTFSAKQFLQNQIRFDLLKRRFISWLLAGEKLRDRRCLWVKLSVPLKEASPQDTYATLERAWFNWYRWWRPRFPVS